MVVVVPVGAARVGGGVHRAAAADAAGGAGGGDVHDQLPHVHVDADLLGPPRQPGARRGVARQHRHPDLRLRPHGTHRTAQSACPLSTSPDYPAGRCSLEPRLDWFS